jgi:hypothetical protein
MPAAAWIACPNEKRPGGGAHARRRLVEAARAGDRVALEGVRMIARLFGMDRESASAGENAEQRRNRRQRLSRPILDELRAWIDRQRDIIPPKTPSAKASAISNASGGDCSCFRGREYIRSHQQPMKVRAPTFSFGSSQLALRLAR